MMTEIDHTSRKQKAGQIKGGTKHSLKREHTKRDDTGRAARANNHTNAR